MLPVILPISPKLHSCSQTYVLKLWFTSIVFVSIQVSVGYDVKQLLYRDQQILELYIYGKLYIVQFYTDT